MPSLKSFLPQLAKIVGSTPDALYSRQRALTDLGLLQAKEGRGPGSGVALTGEAVAGIMIALLAADTLQNTDERVRQTCTAKPRDKTCSFTGEKTFQTALGAILTTPKFSKSLSSLSISRNQIAQLGYGLPNDALGSVFEIKSKTPHSAIQIIARTSNLTVRSISAAMLDRTGD
jgi:hypothetical protein